MACLLVFLFSPGSTTQKQFGGSQPPHGSMHRVKSSYPLSLLLALCFTLSQFPSSQLKDPEGRTLVSSCGGWDVLFMDPWEVVVTHRICAEHCLEHSLMLDSKC